MKLPKDELNLLEWLAGPGIARRSECHKLLLYALIRKRMVWITKNGWVRVTPHGYGTLTELMALSADQD